jgi:hypothetical protein
MSRESQSGFIESLKYSTGKDFERRESEKTDIIERRYEELFREQEKLRKAIDTYPRRIYQATFFEGEKSEKKLPEIVRVWKERLREETHFLDVTDRLGIEIFVDDLAHQPNFRGLEIKFDEGEMDWSNKSDSRQIAGLAHGGKSIEVRLKKTSLREQVKNFWKTEKMSEVEDVFVHEMIHTYHFREVGNRDIPAILTEAQAYFSGIDSSRGHSMVDVGASLIKPEKIGGLYEYDTKLTIRAVKAITELYALGKTDDEIADMIVEVDPDNEEWGISVFEKTIKEMKDELGIDEIDSQSLVDIYRLHRTNERMKAVLLLHQVINEMYPREDLIEDLQNGLRKRLTSVEKYKLDGHVHDMDISKQLAWTPINEDFPYDPDNERHMIAFGLFPVSGGGDETDVEFDMVHMTVKGDAPAHAKRMDKLERVRAMDAFREGSSSIKSNTKLNIVHFLVRKIEGKGEVLASEMVEAILPENDDKLKFAKSESDRLQTYFDAAEEDIPAFMVRITMLSMRGDKPEIRAFFRHEGKDTLHHQTQSIDYFESILDTTTKIIKIINLEQVDPLNKLIRMRNILDRLLMDYREGLVELESLLE